MNEMTNEEILAMAESATKVHAESKEESKEKDKKRGFNPWDDFDDLKPTPVPTDLKRGSKRFFVKFDRMVEDTIKDRLTSILPLMNQLEMVNRNTGYDKDPAGGFMMNNYFKKEFHLPFKAAADVKAVTSVPVKEAFSMMLTLDKFFKEARPGMRNIIANTAHVFLGKDLRSPLDFIIVYTPCGSETKKDLMEKKDSKNMYNTFNIAEILGIPIFNFKNEASVEKLKAFVKAKYEPKPTE